MCLRAGLGVERRWWCARAVRGQGVVVVRSGGARAGRGSVGWRVGVSGVSRTVEWGGGRGHWGRGRTRLGYRLFHRHLSAEFPLLGIPCASVDAVDVRVSVASRVSERERVLVCPMGLKAAPPRPSA